MVEEDLAERRRKQTIWLLAIIIVVGIAVIPRCGTRLPRLEGVVVDAESGDPLADVRIESWAEYATTVYGPGGPGGGLGSSRQTLTGEDGRFAIPGKHRRFWWQMIELTSGVFSVFKSGWGVVRGSYGDESVTLSGVCVGGEGASVTVPVRRDGDSSAVGEWFERSKVKVPLDEDEIVVPLVRLRTTEQWEEHFDYLDGLDRFPLELRAEELLRYLRAGGEISKSLHHKCWRLSISEAVALDADDRWYLLAAYKDYCETRSIPLCDRRNIEFAEERVASLTNWRRGAPQ